MQAGWAQALAMENIVIRAFEPSDSAWLVAQHGRLYAQDEGFDENFETLVCDILSAFVARHDPSCEQGWIAQAGDERLGSIFCVRLSERRAKLRLFLLVPGARGQGLGGRLLRTCMTYAKHKGYRSMQLWTHESHKAACALYAKSGWSLVSSKPVHSFGVELVEQSWEIEL